jgi:hypothetical protein
MSESVTVPCRTDAASRNASFPMRSDLPGGNGAADESFQRWITRGLLHSEESSELPEIDVLSRQAAQPGVP